MTETEESKSKIKRGHRKKKFGDEKSKVISFRIAENVYNDNKEEIREKVNNLIESEVKKKKLRKLSFTPPDKQTKSTQVKPLVKNQETSKGLDGYYRKKEDSIRKIRPSQEGKNNRSVEKKSIIKRDIVRRIQPTQVRKNTISPKKDISIERGTIKPKEERPSNEVKYMFHEKHKNKVKKNVNEFITKEKEELKETITVKKQDKTMKKKKIIDEDNEVINLNKGL